MKERKHLLFADKAGVMALVGISILCAYPAIAGTRGSYINSYGYGKAVDSVSFNGITNTATSITKTNPCGGVNPKNFTTCTNGATANLPTNCPLSVYCQSKGYANYIWSVQSFVTGGATADNPDLEKDLNLVAKNCATIQIDSFAQIYDTSSGLIIVNAFATEGAGMRVSGYEYTNGLPADVNELKTNGLMHFDIKMAGPFYLNVSNCTALTIPFSARTGHSNLFMIVDTALVSIPFTITCPPDQYYACGDALVYPPVQVSGGCGNMATNYYPLAKDLNPGTNDVLVTVSDQLGNTNTCTFKAVREALEFHGFYPPIGGEGGLCGDAFYVAKLGNSVPVKFDTTCLGSSYMAGTPTLTIRDCPDGEIVGGGYFQPVANEWHFNWNTASAGVKRNHTYELVATLQDGTERTVFVKLK